MSAPVEHVEPATSPDVSPTHAAHVAGEGAADAHAPAHGAPGQGGALVYAELAILALAVGLLFLAPKLLPIGTLSVVFVSVVLEALPFILLGALMSGVIEVFVPPDKLASVLPARASYTVLLAGLLGVVFPVCECAVIPVVRRLVRKGVPFSAAMTYLLAGPIVNPIVAASTAVAYGFDWDVVLLRMIAGYALAVALGTLMGELFPRGSALLPALREAADDGACGCVHDHDAGAPAAGWRARIHAALAFAAHDFIDIGRFLVLGAFFAGLTQTFVDRRHVLLLMNTPVLSVGLMMALALGLNLCSEADAFVAASYRGLVPMSAQMAFMVLGPMLDIKLMFMYLGLLRRRAIFTLATATIVFVFGTMVAMQFLTRGNP